MDRRGSREAEQGLMKRDYRSKTRKCAAVALEEIADKTMNRELVTELTMTPGYVGYIDDEEFGVRVFAFTNPNCVAKLVSEAKKIGFRTAGEVEGTISMKNSDLERPHLKHVPKDSFYKEYYK